MPLTLDSPDSAEGMRCFSRTDRMSSQTVIRVSVSAPGDLKIAKQDARARRLTACEFLLNLLAVRLDGGGLGRVALGLLLALD